MKHLLTEELSRGRTLPEGGVRRHFFSTKMNDQDFNRFNDLCKRLGVKKSGLVRYGLELAYQELSEIKGRRELKNIIKEESGSQDKQADVVESDNKL